jgi:hypothetical protein
MANKEHLARLQQGVWAWNKWLDQQPTIRPNLSAAYLSKADLGGADLTGAHLREADLTEAHLSGVGLTMVDRTRVDLSGAHSHWTVFGNVDLSTVRGLDTLEPFGPSPIGIETLYRSHGNLPEVFLWGAGVPEDCITSIRSLVGRAFECYACVISYNHTDKPFARRLHDPWQGRGIRGWLDEP